MKYLSVICLLGSMICAAGCSSLVKMSASALSTPINALAARREKPVARILCLWEAAEGQGLDGKPARGFAGQVMFFTYGEPSPIPVNGTVRIFEYVDFDSDDDSDNHKPEHLFSFEHGGWNVHRTQGTLGETYSVFLPYVRKDSTHAVCALRVEYEAPDGRIVSSPYTEVTLASKTSRRPAGGIQRNIVSTASTDPGKDVSNGAADTTKPPEKLESMSIKLPARKR